MLQKRVYSLEYTCYRDERNMQETPQVSCKNVANTIRKIEKQSSCKAKECGQRYPEIKEPRKRTKEYDEAYNCKK